MLQTLLAGRETASLQLTAPLPEGVALHLAIRPAPMLTVDEASIYTALTAGIAISAWHARSAWRYRQESLTQFSEALSRFRSGVLLGFLALSPFVMVASAVVFHFVLGDRYNHAAPYNWVGAFVGFMFLSLVVAGVGSVLLRLSRRKP